MHQFHSFLHHTAASFQQSIFCMTKPQDYAAKTGLAKVMHDLSRTNEVVDASTNKLRIFLPIN